MEQLLVTTQEAATMLRYSEDTVRKLRDEGKLKPVATLPGDRYRVRDILNLIGEPAETMTALEGKRWKQKALEAQEEVERLKGVIRESLTDIIALAHKEGV